MDPAAVEGCLRDRLGEDVSLVGLERSAMGLSRETWFVTLSDRKLVLRCDLPGGVSAAPSSLRFEYEIYRRLAETSIPIARPLFFEEDAERLSRAFYVREFVEGSPSVPHFDDPDPRHDDLRIEVSREHVRKMARVHAIDWQTLGFGELMTVPDSPATAALTAVDRVEAQLEDFQIEPFPLVTEACAWLRERAPVAPAVVLCKGSNGAMQEVWREGEIVAMCDWEMASLGDPANDWARCQGFAPVIPGRWGESQLLDYYEEVSGLRIDPAALEFYRLFYELEMLVVGHHSALPLVQGKLLDARLGYIATLTVQDAQSRLARAMGLTG